MSNRQFVKSASLGLAMLVLLAVANVTWAQEGAELVSQLSGQAEAPQRNAAQLTEAYQNAMAYLLPLMSADNVSSRYDYQIMLQDISSYASRPGAEQERLSLAKVIIETVEQDESCSFRHPVLGYDQVDRLLIEQVHRIVRTRSRKRLMPGPAEGFLENHAGRGFAFDAEDLRHDRLRST